MEVTQHLLELSDRLDREGHTKCADAVDSLMKTSSVQKVAQYVGIIGYVLKQERAMSNCIRKKRVASSESMQQVVMECLKEYQDGQDYQNTEWTSKYAQVIESNPDAFTTTHMDFLEEIGKLNDIDEHLNNVIEVSKELKEANVEDDLISTLLTHASLYGDVLEKEASSTANFKVAAPPSERGWWGRLTSPKEFNAFNPFSWSSSRREKSDDKDAMYEMENVLQRIMSVTTTTQKMRTAIYRLKNQVAGYLSGSNKGLAPFPRIPAQESDQVVEEVVDKINALDANNWNKSILAIQQLSWSLNNSQINNQYNMSHIETAKQLAGDLSSNINKVYNDISEIQNLMQTLRQRKAIRGREEGITEQGNFNPRAMISPAEEFGALEKVLNIMYQNPFDPKAHFYAQKMHARLDDKLRHIQRDEEDPEAQQWSSQYQEPSAAEYPNSEPQSATPGSSVDPVRVDNIVSSLLEGSDNQQETARQTAELLNKMFVSSGLGDSLDESSRSLIREIKDKLIAASGSNSPVKDRSRFPSIWDKPDETDPGYPSAPDFDDEDVLAETNHLLLKIADIFDKENRSLAEIIDNYIEEHEDESVVDTYIFPKISRPVAV